MKIFFVNAVCGSGSTGRIITDLCEVLKEQGHQVKVAYGVGLASRINPEDTVKISNKADYYMHNAAARLTDRAGFYSHFVTKALIHEIKEFQPDLIHLHNLHGFYVNIKMLFEFLAESDIPVIWTLHDCWAMTGHCAYFSYVGCDKWKAGCNDCPQLSTYPKSYGVDQSKRNYKEKKKLFTSIKNMTIVTPSEWLAGIVQQSFLKKYPILAIPNGIDLNVFKPTASNVREIYRIGNKKMVLAVSNVWSDKKGFPDICQLADKLDSRRYQVVMVGLTKDQMKQVPKTILPILRTSSVEELVELYSAADVFVNPTWEDNYPTVNIEALASGTPVVTFKTGGSPEILDNTCGLVVDQGDIEAMQKAVYAVCDEHLFYSEDCVVRAQRNDKKSRYLEYIHLYNDVTMKKR